MNILKNKRGLIISEMEYEQNYCNQYNDETIANYVDNKLTGDELTKFEKHLKKCDYCLDAVQNAIKDSILMEKASFSSIPESLLEKVLGKEEKITRYIAIKLLANYIEIVQLNIKNYLIKNIKYRSDEPKKVLEINEKKCTLKVIPNPDETFGLEIITEKDLNGKNIEIFKKEKKQIRLVVKQKILNQNIYFDNFEKGLYTIKINDIKYEMKIE